MRLMCDAMLHGLARWLRAAGYDTEVAAAGLADAALLAHCRAEGRTLLTRDRALAQAARGRIAALFLAYDRREAQARQLKAALAIDWLGAPFTRCLVDNAALEAADAADWARVPPAARVAGGALRRCPACARLYWPGGHVRRMAAQLAAWNAPPSASMPLNNR
jgi:uncharacterized protein with PIN domain